LRWGKKQYSNTTKQFPNLSPPELINIIRLKNAVALLAKGDYKIYEVPAIVGYSSQSNFARNFQKQFNRTPTEYMHSLQEKK
jgi:AraC-like DNA-binding protein